MEEQRKESVEKEKANLICVMTKKIILKQHVFVNNLYQENFLYLIYCTCVMKMLYYLF